MPKLFIGIDPSSERLAVSTYHRPEAPEQATNSFTNNFDGFEALMQWLAHQGASPEMSIVCVEATGVYAEALCYYLHEHGYPVSVESPHKVKRAFKTTNKNDPTDARQIAGYAYRYQDELPLWQPKAAIIEQIRVLLTTREQLVSTPMPGRWLRVSRRAWC